MNKWLQKYRHTHVSYSEMLERNRAAVTERNTGLLRLTLRAAMVVFFIVLLCGLLFETYARLKLQLLLVIALSAALVLLLRLSRVQKGFFFLYVVYGAFVTYSLLTSALVTPDHLCVTILVFVFMFPILFIDANHRINLATVIAVFFYLLVVCFYKAPDLMADEIVNVICFAALGSLIGSYVRYSQLENFEMKRTLSSFAYTDQLTGLYNRRKFFELLAEAEKPDCASPITAFAMIDIDNFKRYNDTYGHQSGDECLRQLGECFRACEDREPVWFYRYGGEEFVALTRGIPAERFYAGCESLRQSMEAIRIQNTDGSAASVTISVGAAVLEEGAPRKYERLLEQADKALYTAKKQGRNRVVRYTPALQDVDAGEPTFREWT